MITKKNGDDFTGIAQRYDLTVNEANLLTMYNSGICYSRIGFAKTHPDTGEPVTDEEWKQIRAKVASNGCSANGGWYHGMPAATVFTESDEEIQFTC